MYTPNAEIRWKDRFQSLMLHCYVWTGNTSQLVSHRKHSVYKARMVLYIYIYIYIYIYWIGHIWRRTCFLQRVTEGKIQGGIEVTGRQGRRRTKLLDDIKERRGYSHLKEEALDRTMWRARFGRGFGPVVRQTTKWMNSTVPLCYVIRTDSGKVKADGRNARFYK